jgi:hypothetical protein
MNRQKWSHESDEEFVLRQARAQDVERLLHGHGLHTSYWGKRIQHAASLGTFTVGDRNKAASWPDCACGHLSPDIPRYVEDGKLVGQVKGAPKDRLLNELGSDFLTAVQHNNPVHAAIILVEIERRAAHILSRPLNIIRSWWRSRKK